MTAANHPPQAQQSNPAAVRAVNLWLYRNAIEELGDLMVSHGVMISETSKQGYDGAVRVHLLQMKEIITSAIDTFNKMNKLKGDTPANSGGV